MLKDHDTIDTDSIDRACAAAAGVETCCFCGKVISGVMPVDRATDGRTAHYRCSEPAYQAGEWTMALEPSFGFPYEEGDDHRELYYLLGKGGGLD